MGVMSVRTGYQASQIMCFQFIPDSLFYHTVQLTQLLFLRVWFTLFCLQSKTKLTFGLVYANAGLQKVQM